MESDSSFAFYLYVFIVTLVSTFNPARFILFVGGSGLLVWLAYRYLPSGWRRRGVIAVVAAFWIVDLAPGAPGFRILCRTHAGVKVETAIPGRPHVMIGDRIPPAIAARFLHLSGSVEYDLAPFVAERLELVTGLYQFRALEDAPVECLLTALNDKSMLANCATVVKINESTARYLFDASEPDTNGGQADSGPFYLSWWAEKHVVFVLDRETNQTLASATVLLRRGTPSLSGLFSFAPADAACPAGASEEGLAYLLRPAAFPDL